MLKKESFKDHGCLLLPPLPSPTHATRQLRRNHHPRLRVRGDIARFSDGGLFREGPRSRFERAVPRRPAKQRSRAQRLGVGRPVLGSLRLLVEAANWPQGRSQIGTLSAAGCCRMKYTSLGRSTGVAQPGHGVHRRQGKRSQPAGRATGNPGRRDST